MNLKSILKGIDYESIQGDIDIEVNKINYDSRKAGNDDVLSV